MRTWTEVFFPLQTAFSFETRLVEVQPKVLAELQGLSGKLDLTIKGVPEVLPRFQVIREITGLPTEAQEWAKRMNRKHPLGQWTYLHVRCDYEIDPEQVLVGDVSTAVPDSADFCEVAAHDFFASRVYSALCSLFVIMNVAYPACFNRDQSMLLWPRGQRTNGGQYGDSDLAVDIAIQTGWPAFLELPIDVCWRWATKIPDFVEGVGRQPAGRALAALSYLFRASPRSDSSLDAVWALLGLEAIYTRSNISLREQILAKSEVMLGKPDAFVKRVGKMYDFRSRFLHGDVDFPLRHAPFDEMRGFHEDHREMTSTSIALLIATLQRMVSRDAHELVFEYQLR
jgi:hypothetical protein